MGYGAGVRKAQRKSLGTAARVAAFPDERKPGELSLKIARS
jgi:hypothetical protein